MNVISSTASRGRRDSVLQMVRLIVRTMLLGWLLGGIACSHQDIVGTQLVADSSEAVGGETSTGVANQPVLPRVDECITTYANALVCEGFENGLPDGLYAENGQVVVTAQKAVSGTHALYATTSAPHSFADFVPEFPPLFSGVLYYRVWYYLVGEARPKIFGLEGWNDALSEVALNIDVDITADDRLSVFNHANRNTYLSQPAMVPKNQWFCLHGYMELSADAGIVVAGINGETIVSTRPEPTLPTSGVSRAVLGIGWSGESAETIEVYLDNLVLHTTPIGCD